RPPRHTLLAVPLQHQLVEQSELVVQVLTDVPVHTEEGIATELDADSRAPHRDGPEHRQHAGATEADRHEVGVDEHVRVLARTTIVCDVPRRRADKQAGVRVVDWTDNDVSGEVRMAEIEKTDEEWRSLLTPEQYQVLRRAGTERPWSGKYVNEHSDGTYCC